jgi:hypothetical protein
MDQRESSMAAALSNGLAVTIRALPPGDLERVAAAVRLLARESRAIQMITVTPAPKTFPRTLIRAAKLVQ